MEGWNSVSNLPFDEVFLNDKTLKKNLMNCFPWAKSGIGGEENPKNYVREMVDICLVRDDFIEKVGIHKESGTVVFLCDEFDADWHLDVLIELGLQAYYIDGQTVEWSFFALTSQRGNPIALDLCTIGRREYHRDSLWAMFPHATYIVEELRLLITGGGRMGANLVQEQG